jgi:hypothetical protein
VNRSADFEVPSELLARLLRADGIAVCCTAERFEVRTELPAAIAPTAFRWPLGGVERKLLAVGDWESGEFVACAQGDVAFRLQFSRLARPNAHGEREEVQLLLDYWFVAKVSGK